MPTVQTNGNGATEVISIGHREQTESSLAEVEEMERGHNVLSIVRKTESGNTEVILLARQEPTESHESDPNVIVQNQIRNRICPYCEIGELKETIDIATVIILVILFIICCPLGCICCKDPTELRCSNCNERVR